jgi:hypothetical protein
MGFLSALHGDHVYLDANIHKERISLQGDGNCSSSAAASAQCRCNEHIPREGMETPNRESNRPTTCGHNEHIPRKGTLKCNVYEVK